MKATTELPERLRPSERSPYAAVRHFDLSRQEHRLTGRQWNPRRQRALAEMRGGILHAWDTQVDTMAIDRARHGEPLALARRGLGTPYTICAGVTEHSGEPIVALIHPPERYTFASDAGNAEWMAIGVMGRFPFKDPDPMTAAPGESRETDAMILAVGAALDLAARLFGAGERDAGPRGLITHRQAVNGRGDHRGCPGEGVVRMAMQADAVRRGAFVPEPDIVLVDEYGRPWPDAWRRHLPTFAAPVNPPAPTTAPKRVALNLPPPPVTGEPNPRGGGEVG